jgi:hypothetical protein
MYDHAHASTFTKPRPSTPKDYAQRIMSAHMDSMARFVDAFMSAHML